MNNFAIVTDTTSDLSKELRERFDIDYVICHVTYPDGKERESKLEWDSITSEEFYQQLKKNPNGFSTSPASPEEYKEAFKKHLDKGLDVLALSISTGLSATFKFMTQAAEELKAEYPDRKVLVIDSLRYSTGLGLLVIKASQLRSEGLSVTEVYEKMEEIKNTCHQMGFLDDLSFVASKGRLTKSKAFMGKLIGIKPLGEFDYNGLTTVIAKTKGDAKAIRYSLEYMKKTIIDPENQIVFIACTNRMKQALEFKALIEAEVKPKEVIITEVFQSNGVNVGPGLMCGYYFGTTISKGLVKEKELMAEIIGK